jgi:hypothetical protein
MLVHFSSMDPFAWQETIQDVTKIYEARGSLNLVLSFVAIAEWIISSSQGKCPFKVF